MNSFRIQKIMCCRNPTDLLPVGWKRQIAAWFAEDCPSFDYARFAVGDDVASMTLYAKTCGILAGVPFFTEIFALADCKVEWLFPEGDYMPVNTGGKIAIAIVTGLVRNILRGERIGLNLLSRSSSIATLSGATRLTFDFAAFKHVMIADQTTPGFKLVESYAMKIGGIHHYDQDPSVMIMLTKNHIQVSGSVKDSIKAAKCISGDTLRVWVEVDNVNDAIQAAILNADVVLMRSIPFRTIEEVIEVVRENFDSISKFGIEVSRYFYPEFKLIYDGDNIDYHPFMDRSIDVVLINNVQGTPRVDFCLKWND
ncbi:Nicotinate-nucleotide pyrophosphorylase carboxylating [Blumeria hordei DH14]|uniref:Nicotinate-nucleotide pyrophosphorylase carboxylating n=1 Tax=Blumeria graminis f. sp. hordei (strain DH14) TaxID=546991 RepID=N1JJ49_BLUG1|nr:Nicotinate-nucleotide pyrophosphorylase carboxylating [Blumeria hordei DH14]